MEKVLLARCKMNRDGLKNQVRIQKRNFFFVDDPYHEKVAGKKESGKVS